MSRRASSLQGIDLSIGREIGSKYDNVKTVADNIDALVTLSSNDFTALVSAIEEVVNFEGITIVVGDAASWDAETKVLTVPVMQGEKGNIGDTGANGLTPIYAFIYNEITGDLEYSLTGYEDQTSQSIIDIINSAAEQVEEW